jgi:hypothetical protein
MGLFATGTPLINTNINQLVASPVVVGESLMVVGWKITYNGSIWSAINTFGSIGTVGQLAFDFDSAVADTLVITLSLTNPFVGKPAVVVSPGPADSYYWVKGGAASATTIWVKFYDFVTANWNLQTPVTPADTNMQLNMICIGTIA